MNTLSVPETYQRSFFNYLKTLNIDVKNWTIKKTEYDFMIVPYVSEFKIIYKNNEIDVSIAHDNETPLYDGNSIGYLLKITISHESMDVLKELTISFTDKREGYGEIQIFHSRHHGFWDRSSKVYGQSFDNLFLPGGIKTGIIDYVDKFIKSKERYYAFGRSYKLCFLFTGVPGAGKSSLIKCIAMKYSRPIYVLNLSKKIDDEILTSLMGEVQENSILVLEDIDSFFVDRESKDINVSFSAILNAFDGLCSPSNGIMIFMTANNPERLDTALIRPGRVDRIIKFEYPRKREVKEAFTKITGGTPEQFNLFYNELNEKCISMAGIVDYLFRHSEDYLENVSELNEHAKMLHEITEKNKESIYK